jgi:hypothetical protein
MIKIKNTREIIIGFILFAIVFFLYSDKIVTYVSTLNPIIVLIISVLLNPVYVFLIFSLFQIYGWRGVISGFLISTASDLISLPHIFTANGQLSNASYNLVTDSTFMHLLPDSIKSFTLSLPIIGQVSLGVVIIYLIISTALIILSLMVAHNKKFKEIFMKAA